MEFKESGESSRKKDHDKIDSDRPLKKARYLWQVKGNYHLRDITETDKTKDDRNDTNLDCDLNSNGSNKFVDNDTPSISNQGHNSSKIEEFAHRKDTNRNDVISRINDPTDLDRLFGMSWPTNNNITRTRNNNVHADRSCIEELIASSDRILEYPDGSPPRNIERSISDEIPITLVTPHPKNEDYYLRKWQARQIAKGFVDNTINRVLENWMVAPFDAADLVDNAENGGQVEDEGIMMAIQSHGLQSGTQNRLNDSCKSVRQNKARYFTSASECNCSTQRRSLTSSQPLTFFPMSDLEYYHNLCILKNSEPVRPNQVYSPGGCGRFEPPHSEESKENDPRLTISENLQDIVIPNNYETLRMDDTDFLETAVSAAIRKKGLTSYNCVDYG